MAKNCGQTIFPQVDDTQLDCEHEHKSKCINHILPIYGMTGTKNLESILVQYEKNFKRLREQIDLLTKQLQNNV